MNKDKRKKEADLADKFLEKFECVLVGIIIALFLQGLGA